MPSPVASHKIMETMITFCVILLHRGIVELIFEIGIRKQVFDNCTRIAIPDIVCRLHPWRYPPSWQVTTVHHSKGLPPNITKSGGINCLIEVHMRIERWILIL